MQPDDPAVAAPDPVLAVWALFLRAHALVRRSLEARLAGRSPIGLADLEVLLQLEAAPDGRLRMAVLAERVLLSRSGITRRIERLERLGLVERQACPNDARGAYAVATPRGRALGAELADEHRTGIREVFGGPLEPGARLGTLRAELEALIAAAELQPCPSAVGCATAATRSAEAECDREADGGRCHAEDPEAPRYTGADG